jgi:hypothetical protein
MIYREAQLNQSLTELAPAGGGDWADVVARSDALGSAQHRRRLITIAITFATFLICTGTTLAVGNQLFGWFRVSTPSGWFKVETSKSKAPATRGLLAYVAGQTLYRPHKRPQRLAYPLRPMFSNDNLVVSSPDARYIVYQAVRLQRKERPSYVPPSVVPMLYVHDTIARREKLLARGALSAAWSEDGRIAYFITDHERYGHRPVGYVGQVVVQTLDGAPTVWTRRSARYEVLAWARDELIVRVDECLDLNCPLFPDAAAYALERSGRLRPLHLETVIALSPDGRYALGPVPVGHDEFSPLLRLVRIDTGKIVTTINLTRSFRRAIPGLVKPEVMPLLPGYASWRGSEIVCEFASGNYSWLAIFGLRGHRLELESIFRVPAGVVPKRKYGSYFGVPFLTGPGNARIIVTVDAVGSNDRKGFRAILVCSRARGNCVLGELFPYGTSYRTFSVVRNQSRPLARSVRAGSPQSGR